jgi:metal-responsive CopG/Arc/MetJ family transcriptional regulator
MSAASGGALQLRENGCEMFKTTLKFDKNLMQRIKKCSELAGYSSPEEFVQHIVEKELARLEDAESDEEIVKKMKGLGYLE